jgi:hypothetical protein
MNSHLGISSLRRHPLLGVAYWLLLALGCVAFYLMNIYTVLMEEDMFHATIEGTHGQPINSLLDVLRSWWNHYLDCNGRTANLADYLFNGLLGKAVFNVCNTLVFGLLAHLISRLATGRNSLLALALFFAFVILAMPLPGETMLWLAGSCNYMWAVTASLAFTAYLLWHRNPKPGPWMGLVVMLLSFLVGASNEGTTLGFTAGLLLYFFFHRGKVDRAVLIAMTGFILGNILLLTSPGTWHRAAGEVGGDLGLTISFTDHFRLLFSQSVKYVAPALAVLACLAALVSRRLRQRLFDTPWPLVFLSLLAFVLVLGKAQERPYTAFALVAFIVMLRALDCLVERQPWIRLLAIVACLAICGYKYPHHLNAIKAFKAHFQQIEASIRQTDSRQVILKTSDFGGFTRFMKFYWLNSCNYFIYEEPWCIHFDKDNIQFVTDSIYDRYHQGRLLDGAYPISFTTTHPADVEALMSVQGDYYAIKMKADTISLSYQFAQTQDEQGNPLKPIFYFPVLYQGHEYFIFPSLPDSVAHINFPALGLDHDPVTLNLPTHLKRMPL